MRMVDMQELLLTKYTSKEPIKYYLKACINLAHWQLQGYQLRYTRTEKEVIKSFLDLARITDSSEDLIKQLSEAETLEVQSVMYEQMMRNAYQLIIKGHGHKSTASTDLALIIKLEEEITEAQKAILHSVDTPSNFF